jgi:cysteine-rich repeat protein
MWSQDKKGVSILIGYVLLIAFAVIMAVIVFQWIKTYVPTESLSCPDGVSIFIKDYRLDCGNNELNVTLRNNGRFDIGGFFIRASNYTGAEIDTIEFSRFLNLNLGGMRRYGSSVIYLAQLLNLIRPGAQVTAVFDYPSYVGDPKSITIIPTRFQIQDNKQRFVSCDNAEVKQIIQCTSQCFPDCTGRICGGDGCGGSCGTCTVSGDVCQESTGTCVPQASCTDNCSSLGFECGLQLVCGGAVDCNQEVGGCSVGFVCDSGHCVSACGDGLIEPGESCDDGNTWPGDGCTNCVIDFGWTCSGQPSYCVVIEGTAPDCDTECYSLGLGYSHSNCPATPGQCQSLGGDVQTGGNQECLNNGATSKSVCCCYPAAP